MPDLLTPHPPSIGNDRPQRKYVSPIPGKPGGAYVEVKSRWFIASNTGRGYALTGQEMNDTGILSKAGKARGIAGFDGYKD